MTDRTTRDLERERAANSTCFTTTKRLAEAYLNEGRREDALNLYESLGGIYRRAGRKIESLMLEKEVLKVQLQAPFKWESAASHERKERIGLRLRLRHTKLDLKIKQLEESLYGAGYRRSSFYPLPQ